MSQQPNDDLSSRHVKAGPERAPHRAFYYAMGLTEQDIAKPFVGVVSSWNESAPCNTALKGHAEIAKRGVSAAGGTPREFVTITVTDGIAMGHSGMKSSLVSRETIADSVELSVRGHCYDALVAIAGCDKTLPAMMMAMVRLNVPSVFMYGGSILPGNFHGKDVTVQDVYEAVGKYQSGQMPLEELTALEKIACPSAGACGGQFTANTMACVSEAIGLALPGSSSAPAVIAEREAFAFQTGEAVMRLLKDNLRPRDIVTRKALENAAAVVAATGGSTNGLLHLPAIANEAGIDFDVFDIEAILKRTPYIADLKPGGKYVASDMHRAGGVLQVLKTLLDGGFLHGDCMTVSGKTMAENLKRRDLPHRPGRGASGQQGAGADRRRAGAEGQPGAGRRGGEGGGPCQHQVPRHRLVLRPRGGCVRRGARARLQGGRRDRHPLRRAEGRPRHARDAGADRGDLRPGHGAEGGADHRRALLRRHPRLLHRPCRAGGGGGRARSAC